ncbi:hypothetical protein Lpl7_0368 [Lacticaseibacillus paracasei subsp. tolerans Lpl7]|nr:hypothetical protein Lpl7_0368 [Lacticaseibacillus paracasei subsp. tolerans Lpl7]
MVCLRSASIFFETALPSSRVAKSFTPHFIGACCAQSSLINMRT